MHRYNTQNEEGYFPYLGELQDGAENANDQNLAVRVEQCLASVKTNAVMICSKLVHITKTDYVSKHLTTLTFETIALFGVYAFLCIANFIAKIRYLDMKSM